MAEIDAHDINVLQADDLAWAKLMHFGFPYVTAIDAGLPFQELLSRLKVQLPTQTCWLNIPSATEQMLFRASNCEAAGATLLTPHC